MVVRFTPALRASLAGQFLLTIVIAASTSSVARAVPLVFNSYGWSNIYTLDSESATGAAELIPPADIFDTGFLSNADAGPDHRIYGTGGSDLYRIDLSGPSSQWTEIGKLSQISSSGVAWSPEGELYVGASNTLYQIDPATGVNVPGESLKITYPEFFRLDAFDFAPDGTLYAIGIDELFTIDRTTGVATLIYKLPIFDSHGHFIEIDFGRDGTLRVLTYFDHIFEFDPVSKVASWSTWKVWYNGGSATPSTLASVPEPATWLLSSLGAMALCWWGTARTRRGP